MAARDGLAVLFRMSLLNWSRFLLLLLLLAGCHSARESGDGGPAPKRGPATLEVDNRGFPDMTVYVLDGARRERLGVARGHSTTPLTIPDRLVRGGSASLRFYCDPIGGSGLPVSEEIVVEPGDTVELIIPSS
ncbi:MAG: hypothetical protein ACREM9_02060 [Gemmatimonadales bacterium]